MTMLNMTLKHVLIVGCLSIAPLHIEGSMYHYFRNQFLRGEAQYPFGIRQLPREEQEVKQSDRVRRKMATNLNSQIESCVLIGDQIEMGGLHDTLKDVAEKWGYAMSMEHIKRGTPLPFAWEIILTERDRENELVFNCAHGMTDSGNKPFKTLQSLMWPMWDGIQTLGLAYEKRFPVKPAEQVVLIANIKVVNLGPRLVETNR